MRITHRDNLVGGPENLISYDGAPWMYALTVLEFRGNKVAHERIQLWTARNPPVAGTLAGQRTRGSTAAPPPNRCLGAGRWLRPKSRSMHDREVGCRDAWRKGFPP